MNGFNLISKPGDNISPARHFYLHFVDMMIASKMIVDLNEIPDGLTVRDMAMFYASAESWKLHYAKHFNVLS